MDENKNLVQEFEEGIRNDVEVENVESGNVKPEIVVSGHKPVVDGCWGAETTKKLQEVFGFEKTGKIENQPYSIRKYVPNAFSSSWEFKTSNFDAGSDLIRALQEKVEATVDGFCGLDTVRMIQLYVGVPVTGRLDEITVKAFQEWLNQQ